MIEKKNHSILMGKQHETIPASDDKRINNGKFSKYAKIFKISYLLKQNF